MVFSFIHIYIFASECDRERRKRGKLCFLHKHALKSRRSTIALSCFPGSGVGSLAQLHFLGFRNKWFKSVYATDTLFLDDRFLCLFSLIEINISLSFYVCWKERYSKDRTEESTERSDLHFKRVDDIRKETVYIYITAEWDEQQQGDRYSRAFSFPSGPCRWLKRIHQV